MYICDIFNGLVSSHFLFFSKIRIHSILNIIYNLVWILHLFFAQICANFKVPKDNKLIEYINITNYPYFNENKKSSAD